MRRPLLPLSALLAALACGNASADTAAMGGAASSGPSELNRATAKALLEAYAAKAASMQRPPNNWGVGTSVPEWATGGTCRDQDTTAVGALARVGYATLHDTATTETKAEVENGNVVQREKSYPACVIGLGPKVPPDVRQGRTGPAPTFVRYTPGDGGSSTGALYLNTGVRGNFVVTGISMMQGGQQARIEYSYEYVPHLGIPVRSIETQYRGRRSTYTNAARYDDGWRLVD